jgi:hypothetical protein
MKTNLKMPGAIKGTFGCVDDDVGVSVSSHFLLL